MCFIILNKGKPNYPEFALCLTKNLNLLLKIEKQIMFAFLEPQANVHKME